MLSNCVLVLLLVIALLSADANPAVSRAAIFDKSCIHYATVHRPDTMRKLCTNVETIQALQHDQTLSVGTAIQMVVYDPTGQHLLGRTSLVVKQANDWLYTESIRNRDVPTAAGSITAHDNLACVACHSMAKNEDKMFTLPQLRAFAKTGQVQTIVCNRLGRRPCDIS